MVKTYLEKISDAISYDSLDNWQVQNINEFSHTKNLYVYQEKALVNISKILNRFFIHKDNSDILYNDCLELGMNPDAFNIKKYEKPVHKTRGIISERFIEMSQFYPVEKDKNGEEIISTKHFFNRAAFWMATGSGKSLVLIKTIEYINYLMEQNLIPTYDILVLLPREDLIKQFNNEVEHYNRLKTKQIDLINLKNYEKEKNMLSLNDDIKVFYYRSDLIRSQKTENLLDYKDYQNNGNWYIFLDEAHRGETGSSLIQDYISVMSRKGFLFNFSATFTDEIDYATTTYNFNLERFINAGYGKKISISDSCFKFSKNDVDDFTISEKQEQVLLSLLNLALVKKTYKPGSYHSPMMLTLVNSVNTDSSDLMLFFKEIEKIAIGDFTDLLFNKIKNKLKENLVNGRTVFDNNKLIFKETDLDNITLSEFMKLIFNSETNGKIEMVEGEKGKEIALKLETSSEPFALIKIGDTNKFKKEHLGKNYTVTTSYYNNNFFENLNNSKDINILIGSRSFYEGWDSNRPNVINYINIGGKDAQKYVLQSIGRGIRIEPRVNERRRLSKNNPEKNYLLETLFIYATDKKGVESVLQTIDQQKNKDTEEETISLEKTENKIFDLLIPKFKKADIRKNVGYFNASQNNIGQIKGYFNSFDKNLLVLLKGLSPEGYDELKQKINSNNFFQINNEFDYKDLDVMLDRIISFISLKSYKIHEIKELTDEIIHFQHIKVFDLTDAEKKELKEKIENVQNYYDYDKKDVAKKLIDGTIIEDEFDKIMNSSPREVFKNLEILKLANHYYVPVIYSTLEKVEYIKNIINVESEVEFLTNIINHIEGQNGKDNWMFSKIDERLDNIFIPYYSSKHNEYRKFFPDFIFWVKKGSKYKITFADPKGTSYSDYINKIDGFEELFYVDGIPKEFNYNDRYTITFELKMITNDLNKNIPNKYRSYWLNINDFTFLDI